MHALKTNTHHFSTALDRMIQNYSVHNGCSVEEAIYLAEGVLIKLRKKTNNCNNSPYSLGPLDPAAGKY